VGEYGVSYGDIVALNEKISHLKVELNNALDRLSFVEDVASKLPEYSKAAENETKRRQAIKNKEIARKADEEKREYELIKQSTGLKEITNYDLQKYKENRLKNLGG